LMENAFTANVPAELHCLDTWEGGIEHNRAAMGAVEARFDRNLAIAKTSRPWVQVHKIKSVSRIGLATLLSADLPTGGHRGSFDFIYVDGSHQAADVLTDLVFAFDLCRKGGVILCDDYLWGLEQNPLLAPKIAIDAFVNCYATKVAPLIGVPIYQLGSAKWSTDDYHIILKSP
jgi:hypothetical protein